MPTINGTHDVEATLQQFSDMVFTHRFNTPAFHALWEKFSFHPTVTRAFTHAAPQDMRLLVLEWPHVAQTDAARLAYTRDEKAMLVDRQTVTSVGKYLRRHFSHDALPDHIIRDLCALTAAPPNGMRIVRTMPEILHHVVNGPRSCMGGVNARFEVTDAEHPYRVYDPDLGWGLAIRTNADGETVGRCLVYKSVDPDEADQPGRFVRSYKREDNGYSTTDEGLEAWLRDQGYVKASSWEDAFLRYIRRANASDKYDIVAPYLDGNVQMVRISEMLKCLVVTPDGEIECDRTDGTGRRAGDPCGDCGDYTSNDDSTYVGRNEDHLVCSSCCDYNYTFAYSRRGYQRYIHNDDAIEVDGEYYDVDYVSDNDIVCLHDGDYVPLGSAVYIESMGDWYLSDDDDVVYLPDGDAEHIDNVVRLANDEWCLLDEAWQCAESGNWYANDDIDPVTIDGKTYHPNASLVLETEEATEE